MAIPGPPGKLNVRQFVTKSLNLKCAECITPTVCLMLTCTCEMNIKGLCQQLFKIPKVHYKVIINLPYSTPAGQAAWILSYANPDGQWKQVDTQRA